jgi:hypothetical protein
MKDIELEIADSFDRIFPPLLVESDWRDVMARAEGTRKGSMSFYGFRGRRVAALVLAALVVAVASAFAFAAVRDFVFGAGHSAPASSSALQTPAYAADDGIYGTVSIRLRGRVRGPQMNATGHGRFTLSGAITDRGTFLDVYHGIHPIMEPYTLTLSGTKGTITIAGNARGPWTIIGGTRSYAGLHGRGRVVRMYRHPLRITMIGTVSQ